MWPDCSGLEMVFYKTLEEAENLKKSRQAFIYNYVKI